METKWIDGKQIAREVRAELKSQIAAYREQGFPAPKLTVILVGEDPASQIYVNNKTKACGWIGMESETIRMPENTTEEELLRVIVETRMRIPRSTEFWYRCRCRPG